MQTLELVVPIVHENGSGKRRLVDLYTDAYEKLDEAYAAIKKSAPNGRDYYPIAPGALEEATRQHNERLRKVDALMKEVEAILEAVETGETETTVRI